MYAGIKWINIPFKDTFSKQNKIPTTHNDFFQYAKLHISETINLFPIREYDKAKQAIKIFDELFNTTLIPSYLNELPDLLDPDWDLEQK
ncbi:hypothetical protein C2G38_2171698 [Gigaspora rosea]|uniref:Uncharacterized protein n=1 Tax=Gigaspora rosea TaxID=44941 RepID=A0A397VW93_9GLOM|nr:hypothetical protein C2G38_2171698 [Gigaspora rosea]